MSGDGPAASASEGAERSHRAARRVAIGACTFRRNDRLAELLERCAAIAAAADGFEVGMVVVDDNPDRSAAPVAASFEDRFALGVHYAHSGQANISLARNLLLDTALAFADQIAMTDDDCLPELDWVVGLREVMARTSADVVSGVTDNLPSPDAPRWVTEQDAFGFTEAAPIPDGAPLEVGQTNNCLIDAAWLTRHPDLRFDPEFGRIGGEDMVFFRAAAGKGMRAHHAAGARVVQVEAPEDCTLRAISRTSYWLGNSEAVTNLTTGSASRPRLALRAGRRAAGTVADAVTRVGRREPLRGRRALIGLAGAAGLLVGAAGVRVRHP